jgi:fibronectin type 3 domain-containing protein
MGCGRHVSTDSYRVVIQAGANHVVDLNWNASTSTDVAGYNVYRSPDASTWKKVNVSLVASTAYADSTVANGSTYYYFATAVDTSGHESTGTPAVEVVIP